MDASIAGPLQRVESPILTKLGRIVALSTIAMLAAMGLVICARRASGALAQPLSPGVMAALGLILAALALSFRRTVGGVRHSRAASYVLGAAPSAVLVIWAAAISLKGSPPLGLLVLAGAFLLEEGYSWGRLRAGLVTRAGNNVARKSTPLLDVPASESATTSASAAADDEGIMQHVVRRREPTGEVIEGWLRVDLATGQRYAAAHLAICPPLARLPECFAEQMDGPEARVTIGQVLTYGVRFDIKLDREAEEATSVAIEFSIQEPPRNEAAT